MRKRVGRAAKGGWNRGEGLTRGRGERGGGSEEEEGRGSAAIKCLPMALLILAKTK